MELIWIVSIIPEINNYGNIIIYPRKPIQISMTRFRHSTGPIEGQALLRRAREAAMRAYHKFFIHTRITTEASLLLLYSAHAIYCSWISWEACPRHRQQIMTPPSTRHYHTMPTHATPHNSTQYQMWIIGEKIGRNGSLLASTHESHFGAATS